MDNSSLSFQHGTTKLVERALTEKKNIEATERKMARSAATVRWLWPTDHSTIIEEKYVSDQIWDCNEVVTNWSQIRKNEQKQWKADQM